MIICRTPYRISFFGGGTDYPEWYRENGGAVLSTTINKYSYITLRYLPPFFDYQHRIRYYHREEVNSVEEIRHPSIRECFRYMQVDRGIDLVHHGDLPAQSGLGTSSTFTVGLLHGLHALQYRMPTKRQLALGAIDVEQNRIGESVGSQDQTAAAFGGINLIEFGGPQEVLVTPLILSPQRIALLHDNMLLYFTGLQRQASEIAAEQIRTLKERRAELTEMIAIVHEAVGILASETPIQEFGRLLHHQWELKRKLSSGVSNATIDTIYAKAMAAGAIGGKLLGAGGGGFMLFFVEPQRQAAVKEALTGLLQVPFRFDMTGSQIIYHAPTTDFED
jgi:D-glycero-alpha-D-manno-heptose-7-phosphate kinase